MCMKTFETIEFDDHFLVFILHEKVDPNVFVWSSQLYDYNLYGLYTQPVLYYKNRTCYFSKKYFP